MPQTEQQPQPTVPSIKSVFDFLGALLWGAAGTVQVVTRAVGTVGPSVFGFHLVIGVVAMMLFASLFPGDPRASWVWVYVHVVVLMVVVHRGASNKQRRQGAFLHAYDIGSSWLER